MECSKSDWKLFGIRIAEWQEAYMERLTKEYMIKDKCGFDKRLNYYIGENKSHVPNVRRRKKTYAILQSGSPDNVINVTVEFIYIRVVLEFMGE